MYEVYLIENSINDKVYVGITSIGINDRWICHKSCARNGVKYPLYEDMRNFGIDKFTIKKLDSTDSIDLRDSLEISYIKKYNSVFPNGYNLTEGGFHTKNPLWYTDDTQNKLRGDKIRNSLKGKPKSESHRKHLSESRLGRFKGEDNHFYGKHHTDETKEKISNANSKRPISMIDPSTGEVLKHFNNIIEGARYVTDCGLAKSVNASHARIRVVAFSDNQNCTAYGFHWRLDKVQRLLCTPEDELQVEAQSIVEQHDNDIV